MAKEIHIYPSKKRKDRYEIRFNFEDTRLKKLVKSLEGVTKGQSTNLWYLNKNTSLDKLKEEYAGKLSFKVYERAYKKKKSFINKYGLYLAAALIALAAIFQTTFMLILSLIGTLVFFIAPFFYARWNAVPKGTFKGLELLFFAVMFASGSLVSLGFIYQPFSSYWCPPGYEELSTHSIISQFDMPGSVRGIDGAIECSGESGTLRRSFRWHLAAGYLIWVSVTISISTLILRKYPSFRKWGSVRTELIRLGILLGFLFLASLILSQVEVIREPLSQLSIKFLYPDL